MIFPIIIIVYYSLAYAIVQHNSDIGAYDDPKICLGEILARCRFQNAAHAAIFSSILVFANVFIDVTRRLYGIFTDTDRITQNCVANNFFQFLILLGCSIPYLTVVNHTIYESMIMYIIFCESTAVAVIAASLVKLNCVDRNRILKIQYSAPVFLVLCVSQLLYYACLVETDNVHKDTYFASFLLYYLSISILVFGVFYEFYFIVLKLRRNEPLVVFEVLLCCYGFILLTSFIAVRSLRQKTGYSVLYQDEDLVSGTAYISIYILLAMFLTTIEMNKYDFNAAQSSAISFVNKASELEILAKNLELEKTKNYKLLKEMLPVRIIKELQSGKVVTPESFSESTIFFSDIEGFTRISSQVEPVLVVNMLNQLYTMMDHVSSKFATLYKVETIGDAYVICSGLPERNVHHIKDVIDFAIIINELVQLVKSPLDNVTNIKIRIGCHTGPIIAGVVGLKMPRYCLFGDTINTTSRMESSGEAGKIHVSETLALLLLDKYGDQYIVQERGVFDIKGKGAMTTYFVQGATPLNTAANSEAISVMANEINAIFVKDIVQRCAMRHADATGSFSIKSSFSYSINVPSRPRRISAYDSVMDTTGRNQYNILVLGSIQMQIKIHVKLLSSLLPDAVVHTADGSNFTDILTMHKINLILYDEEDPYVTPDQFMQSVKTMAVDAHVIALIADYRTLNHFKDVTNGKCAAILVKPLEPNTLKSILNSLNESKQTVTIRSNLPV